MKVIAASAGVLIAGVASNASAGCMLQATDASVADKASEQILKSASSLTTAELVRLYGAPVSLKSMAGSRQQMTWALSSGQFEVVADSASGKVLDAKMVASKQSSVSRLAACSAG